MSDSAVDEVPSPEELVRVVALDGPAGSGKSTVSRAVAKEIGWRFVDTGATYRAVTLAVLRRRVDLADHERVAEVARQVHLELGPDPDVPLVLLDGEDVTTEIRSPEVTGAVSAVSAVPAVREVLVRWQRTLVGRRGAVVEGRDIATVVAPHAAVKVYLDARPEVRAQRRAAELPTAAARAASSSLPAGTAGAAPAPEAAPAPAPGAIVTGAGHDAAADLHRQVQAALQARDAVDHKTNRLEPSDGAVHLETSDLTFAEVVAEVIALVEAAGLLDPEAAEHLLGAPSTQEVRS